MVKHKRNGSHNAKEGNGARLGERGGHHLRLRSGSSSLLAYEIGVCDERMLEGLFHPFLWN
jgi:hypothetical protein